MSERRGRCGDLKTPADYLSRNPRTCAHIICHSLGYATLESEANRRAVEGVEKPVGWHRGQPGGYVRDYSDTLLIFLLKGLRPEKYQERLELLGALANLNLELLPDEMIARLARGENPLCVLSSWVHQLQAQGRELPTALGLPLASSGEKDEHDDAEGIG